MSSGGDPAAPEGALERRAARALLVTPAGELLLMQLELAQGRRVWIAPGGGVEPGEAPEAAAAREVFEETGLRVEGLVPVWTRAHAFELDGRWIRQVEAFFLARVARFEPETDRFEELERRCFRGFRWWTAPQIERSPERFAPRRLAACLAELLAHGPPPAPIDVGV